MAHATQHDQATPTGPPARVPRRARRPTRRDVLGAVGLAAAAGLVASPAPPVLRPTHPADLSPYLPRLRSFQQRLHATARAWVMSAGAESIARAGETPAASHVYTVDLAQLMEHFGDAGDAEPYLTLRRFAVDHLIVDDPKESYTKGFVLWRCVPGAPPDASGTTEALRVARALWAGYERLGRTEDRDLALTVLDGYARHATTDQGIWLIRNYYAFATKSYATNTFVIDYDADFVRRVADRLAADGTDPARAAAMGKLADDCYGLMRRTVAPTGLLYDLVQPELKTMYWGLDVVAFSPNDVVQTNNACATAATVARGLPDVARRVLGFVAAKQSADGKVHQYYYGRTGERVSRAGIGAAETMAVARLAALLGDRSAAGAFLAGGMPFWEDFASKPDPAKAWATSEILLGLRDVLALG